MTTVLERPVDRVAADTVGAEQHFNEIYQAYRNGLAGYLGQRIYAGDPDLAEDLANEALLEYWRCFVQRGELAKKPTALLVTIARRKLYNHLRKQRLKEVLIDFSDSLNRPVEARGAAGLDGGYDSDLGAELGPIEARAGVELDASFDPEQMAAELDDAIDEMAAAAKAWRHKRSVAAGVKAGIASTTARLGAEHAAQFADQHAARLAEAEAEQQHALEAFRAAGAEVSARRAQLETTAP